MLDESATNAMSSPCLILAHSNGAYEALLTREFRRLGWEVYLARNGPDARRLARMIAADAIVLHADLAEESGWLTCDKLTREQPRARVILVSDNLSPRKEALAVFVGASGLVDRAEGVARLVEELVGTATSAAG